MNKRFAAPKFWPIWGVVAWMHLVVLLPLGCSLRLHEWFGLLMGRVAVNWRRVVRRNLELCFPELESRAVDALVWRHFRAVGASVAETAAAWFMSDRRLAGHFKVVGLEHLQTAVAGGKGVILFTGHFTTLEICGRPFKGLTPLFACMFSHRSNPLLDAMQYRGRLRSAHEAVASDDVRALLRALRRNAVIWYAPDQMHRGANAALLPFFHELAMTNTATSRLARVSGAAIVPFSYRRVGSTSVYELGFHAPLADIPGADPVDDTKRLFGVLEGFIRLAPEQYMWGHKKFKERPAPLPNVYKSTH